MKLKQTMQPTLVMTAPNSSKAFEFVSQLIDRRKGIMEDLDGRQGGVVCFSQGSILLIRMMLMRLVLLHETTAIGCDHNQQLYSIVFARHFFLQSHNHYLKIILEIFLNMFDAFGA